MEYTIGNKSQQIEYNIQEKISTSHLILKYESYPKEKKISPKNSSKEKSNKLINQIETEKNLKKYYLLLKCDKAYSGITHFYASNINIMKFEKKFFSHFRSLIVVDLSNNNLSKIPGGLFKLKYIKELNLEKNHINYIQHQLSSLINLEKMNLAYNEISFLPNSLFKLQKLQILLINYNKIKLIPIEIGLMKNLTRLNIFNNSINELPTTLCNNTKLKNIDFEWIYILKKSFYLSDFKEMPDDDEIYEKCLKFFSYLFNKHILYCDKNTFFSRFSVPESLYSENILSNLNNIKTTNITKINEAEIKLQKRNFFNELIKYIKLKDIQNVYKYTNLILNQPDFKDEDFLSKNKMTPFHYLFSSFKQIKTSNMNRQNKNMSNITEKDSMIINENNKVCSSRGNKMNNTAGNKTHLNINKLDENIIMAKSKIIGNYLFEILSNKIINTKSLDHWGPIHIAIRRGGYECLEWIINKNKIMKEIYSQNNINNSNSINVGNSLTTSIKKMPTFSQKKLFNLNLKGREDWTPLHLSASLGFIDCVYLLLINKAEVYIRNNNYKTPKQVTNISEINKLLTLYELYVLEEKFNNKQKDLIKKNKLSPRNFHNQKSSQYYPSKTNINFFKEIFTSNEYSLNEISEAMNNLTMSVINPINKNFINENILNKFFESTLKELNLSNFSNQNRKNLIIISGFNSIGVSLNNLFLMKLYQNILSTKKMHLSTLIKSEMNSYIKTISSLNNISMSAYRYINIKPKKTLNSKNNNKIKNIKTNNKNQMINYNAKDHVPNPNIKNNKRKINIINLANNSKYKNSNIKKFEVEDSESSHTNSFLLDSDGFNSRNKNLIEKKFKLKNEQGGNTILSSANESCNIQESEISKLSISGIDTRGTGKIKYI